MSKSFALVGNLVVGRVISIENNHRNVDTAKKGQSVAIKIDSGGDSITYGRQFDHTFPLYSKVSRKDRGITLVLSAVMWPAFRVEV